jgi:uncharacterized protein YeaO (DUF488 family)
MFLQQNGGISMSMKIIRLGSDRSPDEGLRIGTVRYPPRGVRKEDIAVKNIYDTWFPNLAPTPELMAFGKTVESESDWKSFVRRFRKEMSTTDASKILDLLAALSRTTNFSIGCYCEDENRCHRSVLRELLMERGAEIV